MTTIKEQATAYEPPQTTKNIADLHQVHVSIDLQTETGTDKEGKQFSYFYIEQENEKYRVPPSVLKQLKVQIENNPNLATFKVVKKGAGMETEYTVIPLASASEKVL